MEEGWIKLHRSITDHPILTCKDHKQFKFWIHLLLTVNWKVGRIYVDSTEVVVKPGEIITSYASLADSLNRSSKTGKLLPKSRRYSIQNIRTYLSRLQKWNMLGVNSTNKYTLIHIVNWEKYQGEEVEVNKPANKQNEKTNKQLTSNQHIYKNGKKEKKVYITDLEDFIFYTNKRFGNKFGMTGLINNFSWWREVYSLEQIKMAYVLAKEKDPWWKDKITPIKLLRRKNTAGEPVDYIGDMLNKFRGEYDRDLE